jgi:DNA-binding response OmpR family regulator
MGKEPNGDGQILVVEDDAEMRRLIAEAIQQDGYKIVELSDGAELLNHLIGPEADAVRLIISDIRPPFCSGMDLLELVRRKGRDTPTILITAFGDEDTRAHATRLGAELLDKPFEISALRAAVRRVFSRG